MLLFTTMDDTSIIFVQTLYVKFTVSALISIVLFEQIKNYFNKAKVLDPLWELLQIQLSFPCRFKLRV